MCLRRQAASPLHALGQAELADSTKYVIKMFNAITTNFVEKHSTMKKLSQTV
jgi:hypothetical protein